MVDGMFDCAPTRVERSGVILGDERMTFSDVEDPQGATIEALGAERWRSLEEQED